MAWELGNKNYQQLIFSQHNSQESFILISHLILDEDIDIRIQLLGMLANRYNLDYINLQT